MAAPSSTSQQLDSSLEQGVAYLDALPYADGEVDPSLRAYVDRLILEEMQNPKFPRRDYLANKPVPEVNFDRSVFIKTELERIAAGKPMQLFDESRYSCSKPAPQLQSDLQAWRAALNNLKAQQEHQGNRVVNMELLQTYAPDVWLLYNKELELFKGQLDKELEALKKEAEIVNLGRKTRQEEIGPKLANLVRKRDDTLYQNWELQKACALLSRDIKKMKGDAEAAGVQVDPDKPEEEEEGGN